MDSTDRGPLTGAAGHRRSRVLVQTLLALLATAVALGVAGCGGSNNGPARSGTGTGNLAGSPLPVTTKVSSPAYRAFVERGLTRLPGVPTPAIPKIIDCVIRAELAQGVTTMGAVKTHTSEVKADGVACARAAGLH